MISPRAEILDKAHLFVLQHMTEVNAYLEEHVTQICQMHPSKNRKWVLNEHNRSFGEWFKERVMSLISQTPSLISNTVQWLAYGPGVLVRSYESKRRILGIDDVVDEDEYNQFDENPPFSTGLPTTYEDDNFDKHYTRNDHDEGMWID
ncbi:hypothetical protein POM88_028481 [Heracleum sosnowskyi]|uniref:Transposase n=2 Tax=Heracleum sosnowskyi TaxID=360622 RepID=A0AAD8MHN7_9APIA|nr:hypothetical protein POM88_028481 [Heracleum sosnowskyi]